MNSRIPQRGDSSSSLADACRPLREICVGHAWCFGKGRTGNLQLLKVMGDRFGFEEIGIPAVEIDGEIVSSTRIRRISAGPGIFNKPRDCWDASI